MLQTMLLYFELMRLYCIGLLELSMYTCWILTYFLPNAKDHCSPTTDSFSACVSNSLLVLKMYVTVCM